MMNVGCIVFFAMKGACDISDTNSHCTVVRCFKHCLVRVETDSSIRLVAVVQ